MTTTARLRTTAPRLLATVLLLAACAAPAGPSAAPTGTSSPPPASPTVTAAPSATPSSVSSQGPSAAPTDIGVGTWARVEATGATGGAGGTPAAREDHTWTVDEATGTTAYLFGGRDGGTTLDDLWAFDLASDAWRRVEPQGAARPAGRFGHEAQWVRGVGLVVFGGQANASTFFGDLWAYDPATNAWTELPAAGDAPVPRYGSCSGVGPAGSLWISHGFTEDGARFFDTREYDFGARRWTDRTPQGAGPVERCLHVCWWTADRRFHLYGGQTTGVAALGDLWTLSLGGTTGGGTWAKVEVERPSERNLPAIAAVRAGGDILMFGGKGIDGAYLADLWLVRSGEPAFDPVPTANAGPGGRAGATLITDTAGRRFLLFGGTDASASTAELWALRFP